MKTYRYSNIILTSLFMLALWGCVKPFNPEGIEVIDNMYVIEGDIIQNDTTRVMVSRSISVNDESKINYVSGALVWVESETGTKYTAKQVSSGETITYLINTVGINPGLKYRLHVNIGQRRYVSALLPVLQAPPVGSVGYNVDTVKQSVTFHVSSNDPTGNTRYYRWFFTEDWEFHSQFQAFFEYIPSTDQVIPIPESKNRYYCWGKGRSSSILVASTTGLTEDRVHEKTLVSMGSGDRRISYLYSMELNQMAISEEAFKYWDNIQKNSDQLGGIFSPQPSEMDGNIICVTNKSEKVIGYISAGIVSKKRIFARGEDIGIYKYPNNCEVEFVNMDNPMNFHSLWERGLEVTTYTGHPPFGESYWASRYCVDCRLQGTKNKPAFWPNNHI